MTTETLIRIPLTHIDLHPENRKHFDPKKLEELAASVKDHGVITPILVRPLPIPPPDLSDPSDTSYLPHRYQLIAGERRLKASVMAGFADIRAIVQDFDDATALEMVTIENLQREDVHPLDEAHGYKRLQELNGCTVEDLAAKVSKSASYIYQRLQLLKLSQLSQSAFYEGDIEAAHAVTIARLAPDSQKKCIDFVTQKGAGSRALATFVRDEIVLKLGRAPFDIADGELQTKAGPCLSCPKHSACSMLGTLFEDQAKADPANGECTDPGCYGRKVTAHIEREILRAADDTGIKPLRLSLQNYTDKKNCVTLAYHSPYVQSKKGEPGAVPAIVVETARYGEHSKLALGDLLWLKATADIRNSNSESSEDLQAKQMLQPEREERKKKVMKTYKQRLFAELSKNVPPKVGPDAFRALLIRVIETAGYGETYNNIYKLMGWTKPANLDGPAKMIPDLCRRLPDLPESDLCRLAFIAPIATEMILDSYQVADQPKSMEALAAIAGVDHAAIRKEIEDAHPKPGAKPPKQPKPPKPPKGARASSLHPGPQASMPDFVQPLHELTRYLAKAAPGDPWTPHEVTNGPWPSSPAWGRHYGVATGLRFYARIIQGAGPSYSLSIVQLVHKGGSGEVSLPDGTSSRWQNERPVEKFDSITAAGQAAETWYLARCRDHAESNAQEIEHPNGPDSDPSSPSDPSDTSDRSDRSDRSDPSDTSDRSDSPTPYRSHGRTVDPNRTTASGKKHGRPKGAKNKVKE